MNLEKGFTPTMMSEAKKDRLIKLLIEVFHEASESEGIYFTDDNSAIEIMELMKEFDPSQDNAKLLNSLINHLTKKNGNKASS